MSFVRRSLWPVMLVVLAVSFVIGSVNTSSSSTDPSARASSLAAQIRCPTCQGLSVADSEAPLAQSSRQEIDKMVAAGQSDNAVKSYFVSRYGPSALLSPPHRGVGVVAWLLPVGGLVVAVGGALWGIRRWRSRDREGVDLLTESDRKRVAEAIEAKAGR